jgi:hypothetical protein
MSVRTDLAPKPLTYCVSAGAASGIWLGFGATRVALLGVGLLVAIVALTVGAPPWMAILPVLAGLMLAAARIGGRPALDWVAPLVGHRGGAASGATRWRAVVPPMVTQGPKDVAVRLSVPAEFGRPRVTTCPDDPSIGIITDVTTKTVTVIFEVCGVDRFPLLDPAERDSLIAGWGDALAVLADTDEALTRLQLIERSCSASAVADPYPDEVGLGDAADWQAEIAAFATTHETRLAAHWTFPRQDSDGPSMITARCQTVCRSLLSARLLARPLSTGEVANEFGKVLTGQPSHGGPSSTCGPVSRRTEWTHVTIDDRLHRTFAVSGWPSAPVGAAWMSPLLVAAPVGVTRTVSLHLERVVPSTAARVARTRRAKASLDQADRARFGMTSSAALDNAEASGVAMDAELAAGYRTHRLVGLVTVSGDTLTGLDEAGRVLRQAAAVCRLQLRPLHGQHDVALAAAAPLCRLRPRGHA